MLKVARAAAFLTLATGINGTVAALYPRYEPIYVYLVAVVIVAWLGGMLLGVTAAVAAVILYDWMFAPVPMVFSVPSIIPLAVAIAAAVVTRLAKLPVPRRQVGAAPTPILLPPIDAPVQQTPVAPVADPDLIASYERRIADARQNAEKETKLRAEMYANAKHRETQLTNDAEALRNAAAEQMAKATAARRELEAATMRMREAESRITALNDELNVAYRHVDEEKTRADRETRLRQQLETAGQESLQKTISELTAKNESLASSARNKMQALQEEIGNLQEQLKHERSARAQIETASKEAAGKILKAAQEKTRVLQRDLESSAADSAVAKNKLQTMQQELDAVREQLKREVAARQHADATSKDSSAKMLHAAHERSRVLQHELDAVRLELQREITARRQHEAASKETAGKTVADMAAKYGTLIAELESQAMRLNARSEELEQQLQATLGAMESEKQRADREQSMREDLEISMQHKLRESEDALRSVETAGVEKLQMAIADLSERYEARLLEAMNRPGQNERIETLEKELAAEREARKNQAAESDRNLSRIVANITSDYESTLGDALVDREAARAEVRNLTSELSELSRKYHRELDEVKAALNAERKRADDEKQRHDSLAADFDKRLEQTLAGVTSDFEDTLATALADRAGARAEIRDLQNKLADMQKKFGAASSATADTMRLIDELRAAGEKERTRADNEKLAREKLDMEWTEKLNKIVTHLATDHEHDLGEALVEKEAAKAEARTLALRLNTLQQKMEQERQAFLQARQKWLQEHAATPRAAPATTSVPAPPAPAADTRGAFVLVVHSDAGIRAMSKHSLEQAGYIVSTAADGLEGMRMATATPKPDIVLAEAQMPKMNGRELVQLLKSRRETADVGIIIMSSGGRELERGSDFRADELLQNSADFNLMRSMIATVLAKRGVRR